MLAPQLKLQNLTVLVDYNQIQSLGRTNDIIDQRNHSHSPELLSMFEEIADRLRNKWEEQHGEDPAHERAALAEIRGKLTQAQVRLAAGVTE